MSDLDLGIRLDGSPFTVPIDAAAARYVVLGKSGAGKTNAGAVMVEEFVRAGVPTIVFDPLGNCWGLRSSADGEGAGLPMVIFGGSRGDVPLSFQRVEYVADLLAEGVSAVLDFSLMPSEEMVDFAYHFLPRLLQRATMNLHVVFEEADRFAPQRAVSSPVTTWSRAARNGGIGWTFSTQKPQVLHKEVIDSANVFVGMRMTGELAQDAVGGEIGSRIGKKSAKHMMSELSTFARGDAWFVPEGDWLGPDAPEGEPERIRFRLRSTFEVRPPRVGEQRREPKMLADVDLERVRAAMAADAKVDETGDADPEVVYELRARISELERELDAVADDRRQVRAHAVAAINAAWTSLEGLYATVRAGIEELEQHRSFWVPENSPPASSEPAPASTNVPIPAAEPTIKRAPKTPPASTDRGISVTHKSPDRNVHGTTANVPGTLTKGVQAIVDAVAHRHPKPVSRNQVAHISGYSVRSSTFDTYVARARSAGLVEGAGDGDLRLTSLGAGVATVRAKRTAADIQAFWLERLGGGERKLLTILIAAYPEPVSRARLAEQSGYSATSSTFDTYCSRIKALGLATSRPGDLRASDDLFLKGKT